MPSEKILAKKQQNVAELAEALKGAAMSLFLQEDLQLSRTPSSELNSAAQALSSRLSRTQPSSVYSKSSELTV